MVCAFAVYSQDQLRVNGANHWQTHSFNQRRASKRASQLAIVGGLKTRHFDQCFADKNDQLGDRSSERPAFVKDEATTGPISPGPSERGLILRA
jgi:hypothetical protein